MRTPTSTSFESAHDPHAQSHPLLHISSMLTSGSSLSLALSHSSTWSSMSVRSPRYSPLFLPSLFLSFFLFLTNKKFMANLYNSAEEGVDTVDVLSFPTEASVGRHTTKIANSVSSRSSLVPSLALCAGSSDQCAVMRVCLVCHAV